MATEILITIPPPEPITVNLSPPTAAPVSVTVEEARAGEQGAPGSPGATAYPGFAYTRDYPSPSTSEIFNTLASGQPYDDADAAAVTSLQLNRYLSGGGNLSIIAGDMLHICGVSAHAVFTVTSVNTPPGANLVIPTVTNGVGVLPAVGSICGIFVSRKGIQGDAGLTGSGLAWVTLTEEDFVDLATPDADTIYDVLLPGETV